MPKISPVAFFALLVCVSAAPNDTPGPLRRQLDERFSAIDREIARRRDAGQADSARQLADQLQYFRDRLDGKAKPANNDPQLHVVGVYEARGANQKEQRFGNATVEVTVTDHPIILVLCAYESVTWNVKVADGVKLQKVILGGYYEQELAQPLNNVPVEIYGHENKRPPYFYAYKPDAESYPNMVKTLKQITGQILTSFQGVYRAQQPFVIGPENKEWLAQCVLHESESAYAESMAFERAGQRDALTPIRFKALELTRQNVFGFTARLSDFTPLGQLVGPSDDVSNFQHIAIDPRGPTYYAIGGHEAYELDLKNGKHTAMPINNRNVPRLSWPCGLAFDTKRARLVLVSLGGEGFMYEYSPQNKQWGLIDSMNNIDLQSFTYSAEYDCYFGLGSSFGGNRSPKIFRFKPNGALTEKVDISEPLPGRQDGPNPGFQLIAIGRQLALLTPPHPDPTKADGENISRCLLINPDTGKVTFSSIMSPQPPLQPAALAPAEFDALWQSALGKDKDQAEAAMWKLSTGGEKAIAFLRDKLPPLAKPNPDKLTATVAKLEHEDFKIREETANELTRLGPAISPDLQAFLKRDIPPGTRSYIETILKRIEAASTTDNLLDNPDAAIRAEARAIAILTRMATPAAVQALQDLASGPPGLPRTTLAKSSLLHLGRD